MQFTMKLKNRVATILSLAICALLLIFLQKVNRERHIPLIEVEIKNTKREDFNNLLLPDVNTNPQKVHVVSNKTLEDPMLRMHPWDIWNGMVSRRAVTSKKDVYVEKIVEAMKRSLILQATTGYRGTQLKAMFFLDGPQGQPAVFKPRRYSRDKIFTGNPYEGYDRHNAEIAAFHLDRILGFYRAPPVVGRFVDLQSEIKPVAKPKLTATFFTDANGNTCFYGKCLYCNIKEPACANHTTMEGALTLWLPPRWSIGKTHNPWGRTYNAKKARWEVDENYCYNYVLKKPPFDKGHMLLDLIDATIFDFLIGNADRHHLEYLKEGEGFGMLLHLDNGKSFGNPDRDEMSILTPLLQCCFIRKSTYNRLLSIKDGSLSSLLNKHLITDLIYPILTDPHLRAIDRRLRIVIESIQSCLTENKTNVLIDDDQHGV